MAEPVSAPDWTPGLCKPKHVAIIMDGNQRWAKVHGLSGIEGHREGAQVVKRVLKACVKQGIEVLTLFAFSSENWRRPEEEVSGLMRLFLESLKNEVPQLVSEGVRLSFFGDLSAFSKPLQQQMKQAMEVTQNNHRIRLNVAVNYGGRWDIAQAAQSVAERVLDGQLTLRDIDEQCLGQAMCLADCPPVDLCVRTSGEERISNFILWQIAYAELIFTQAYWPDFDAQQLQKLLDVYAGRKRRFGRSQHQVEQAEAQAEIQAENG